MTLLGHRGRGPSRVLGGGRSWRALLLAGLFVLTPLSAGCLFPPVATPVEFEGPGSEDEDEGNNVTPVYEQRFYLESQTGTIETGVRLQDTEHGVRPHVFDLPERLDVVRVFLEWNHTVYDLDLSASLIEGPEREPLWMDNDTQGGPGDPDAPVSLEVSDRSKIFRESPTQLSVRVSSDGAADQSYTLTAWATFLVPVE